METETLKIWTIYENPKDYPGLFVVRCWLVQGAAVGASNVCHSAKTLDEARSYVPPYLHRLNRMPGDDPCIVETWI